MEEILFYIREEPYGEFSNFARYPQNVMEFIYSTNEHYYQSMKAKDPKVGAWITRAPTAWLAMCAGRSLRPHEITGRWNEIKVDVMKYGLIM